MSFDHTIKKGTTGKHIELVLRNSSTGQGLTGVSHSSVTAKYWREGASAGSSITMQSGTAGLHFSGSWTELDSTNMPGVYQFSVPDAALATGADAVTISFTVTGAIDKVIRIGLLDVDLRDATDMGVSNLHTVAEIADGVWDETQAGHVTAGTFGAYLDSAVSAAGGGATAADIADAVWDELQADHTTAGSFGEIATEIATLSTDLATVDGIVDTINTNTSSIPTAASIADAVWDELQADHTTAGTFGEIATEVAALPTAADTADAVWDESTTGHAISGTFGELVDAPVSGATAPTEAEIYTYFNTGTRPDVFKADVSSVATSAEIAALNDPSEAEIYTYFTQLSREDAFKADVASLSSDLAVVDSNVDAIKAKTDQFVFTVGGQVDANALTTAAPTEAEIYAHFTLGSNEDAFKADIGSFPTLSAIADAVWDEPAIGHVLSGTTGEYLYTRPTAASIADAVWDESLSGHVLSGSAGEALGEVPTEADIYTHFTTLSNADAFKADVSALATAASVTSVASQITGLNDPTPAEIYSHFTALGNADAFKADVSSLATTIDVTSTVPSEADIYSYFTTSTRPDAFKANVSGLSTFDPAVDVVANVTTVGTVTGDVNTNAASRTASQTDISSLATAASIAALNDVSAADVYAEFTAGGNEDVFKADLSALNDITAADVYNYMSTPINAATFKADVSGLATASALTTVDSVVDAIKVKTDQLTFTVAGQVDSNALSTAAPTEAEIYSHFTTLSRQDAFKADVSALASDSDVAAIKAKTDNLSFTVGGQVDANALTTSAPTAAEIYAEMFSHADDFKADVSSVGIDASGVAAAVWDANVISHTTSGTYGERVLRSSNHNATLQVTGSQHIAADIHETQAGVLTAASTSADFVTEIQSGLSSFDPSVDTVITDTASREASKADISALASQASIDSLNDLSGSEVADSVWNALSASYTLSGSFGDFLDGNVSNAGGTGNGLYRVDVLVQDSSLAAVPNARISVDGTTYELTTNSSGIATFMLDSGVYTLRCAPPENYDVPSDNVVTIVSSDIANTFTVSDTATPPSSSDVPWIG